LNEFDAKKAENDDEFQIVRGRERKQKISNGDTSEEEADGGFEVKRGNDRGNRGRGGFFKNSSKRKD